MKKLLTISIAIIPSLLMAEGESSYYAPDVCVDAYLPVYSDEDYPVIYAQPDTSSDVLFSINTETEVSVCNFVKSKKKEFYYVVGDSVEGWATSVAFD